MSLKDLVNDTQKKKQVDRAHVLRNASCVGSDISWSVSIPIQELTVVIDRQNAEGDTDSALWLLRGDSHRLFLQDGTSKDYA